MSILINKWFHSVEWQGQILGEPIPGTYLVQLYSWAMGHASNQQMVKATDMADWLFYDTNDEMNYAYEHGSHPACRKARAGFDK